MTSSTHVESNASKTIIDAIMRCASELASQRLVSDGPPMTHHNGFPSLGSFETLFTLYRNNPPPSIQQPDHPFFVQLRKLYDLPLDPIVFRRVYMMTNTIYHELSGHHAEALFAYCPDKVKAMTRSLMRKAGKKITITMTTCKRMDLFQRTVNSMLECITDLRTHVFEWIVVDDQTDPALLQSVKEKYPFIRWIEKTVNEKGHPRSMNLLQQEIFTPYHLHIEDDWEFFIPLPYCTLLLERITLQPDVRQVLVNLNYTEDQHTASSIWGAEMRIASGKRYFVHRHFMGQQLQEENAKLACPNSMYWPHFSFRVGLTDMRIYSLLGPFDEQAKHFEMEYAQRYVHAGLKTAFLDGIFCTHIGRRTYERQTEKKNAYDLNQEQQFGEPIKPSPEATTATTAPIPEPPAGSPERPHITAATDLISVEKSKLIDTYVINLKRRTDRLVSFFQRNERCGIPIKIFEGMDGKQLEPTPEIQSLFAPGDFNYRRGIVGCALSHIEIWKRFVADASTHYLIVLEDDVTLTKHFSKKIMSIVRQQMDRPTFDLLFMHYNPYPPYRYNRLYLQYSPVEIETWSPERSLRENMGSGAAYLLTKAGAKQLLQHINQKGVYNAIDWVMFKSGVKTAYTTPMLAFAECVQSGAPDTDIQTVYDTVCYEDWTHQELLRWKQHLGSHVTSLDKDWTQHHRIPLSMLKTQDNNLIVCLPVVDAAKLMSVDKIVVTGFSQLEVIKKTRGPFTWYTTDRCVFVIPYSYTYEEFLNTVPLCENRMI